MQGHDSKIFHAAAKVCNSKFSAQGQGFANLNFSAWGRRGATPKSSARGRGFAIPKFFERGRDSKNFLTTDGQPFEYLI